jgi:hypothetical protein
MNFAYAWAFQYLDLNGFVLTISVADGTYGQTIFTGPLLGALATTSVLVVGDTATPANAIVTSTAHLGSWLVQNGAMVTVEGFAVSNTGTTGNGFYVYAAFMDYQEIAFGAASQTFSHIASTNGATVQQIGPYTISGAVGCHWLTSNAGSIITRAASAITLVGTPSFASAFACAQYPSFINVQIATRPSFFGSATGARYLAFLNGIIDTGGAGATYFPGNSAGSTSTGGQYN